MDPTVEPSASFAPLFDERRHYLKLPAYSYFVPALIYRMQPLSALSLMSVHRPAFNIYGLVGADVNVRSIKWVRINAEHISITGCGVAAYRAPGRASSLLCHERSAAGIIHKIFIHRVKCRITGINMLI